MWRRLVGDKHVPVAIKYNQRRESLMTGHCYLPLEIYFMSGRCAVFLDAVFYVIDL